MINCNGNYILSKGLLQQPRGSTSIFEEDLAEGLPVLYGLSAMDTGPALCFVPPVAAMLLRNLPSVRLVQLRDCRSIPEGLGCSTASSDC